MLCHIYILIFNTVIVKLVFLVRNRLFIVSVLFIMSQFINIQVGQCGNQIGSEFWPLVLKEYGFIESSRSRWNGSINSFLYPADEKSSEPSDLKSGNLRARALLIDMEDSVVSRFERGPLQKLFSKECILKNSGGSGNNWGIGFYEHGYEQYSALEEMLRSSIERCDYLHGFLTMSSLAGGTGSGLGSRILTILSDLYSKTERFVLCVHPGSQYDVINAPYNIAFSLSKLVEHASCVFPVDNEALVNICQNHGAPVYDRKLDTYNSMNVVICKMLLELTSGARFPGSLNLDINDLATNLVPYPSLNFISTSLSPIIIGKSKKTMPSVRIPDIANEILSRNNELLRISCTKGTILSSCLHGRGTLTITNMKQYCQRLKKHCKYPVWSPFTRFSLCSIPPLDSPYSLLWLANSTSMINLFVENLCSFQKLYRKRAYVHHYESLSNFPDDEFDCARESLMKVIESYNLRIKV